MNSLKVGFINSSGVYNADPFRNQPLTIIYLLTYLERYFGDKLELSMIDLRGLSEDDFLPQISENDVYLYTLTTLDFNEAERLIQKLREIYPKAKHIAGGPHITLFPQDGERVFDSIALGEAEDSIIELFNDIFNSELKPVYHQGPLSDLQTTPMPSRKWLQKSTVIIKGLLNKEYLEHNGTSTLFSRGCPFDCHFCSNLEKGSVRYIPYESITQEIEYLKREYGVNALALKDDNGIPVGRKFAQPWLEAIGKAEVKWRGQSRATGVTEDMVRLAKDAGCVEIAVGLETVTPKSMDILNKPLNLKEAKKYLLILQKYGIGIRMHIIVGLPGEPDNMVDATLKFCDEFGVNSVLLSLLAPLPGTAMYNNPSMFGMKNITRDWDDFRVAFGSFDENEKPKMTFEYEKDTPWGKGKSNSEIIDNYMALQDAFRVASLKF
jgi:radical SAM superfamily enzyme YgiQ (UPF0313 family)